MLCSAPCSDCAMLCLASFTGFTPCPIRAIRVTRVLRVSLFSDCARCFVPHRAPIARCFVSRRPSRALPRFHVMLRSLSVARSFTVVAVRSAYNHDVLHRPLDGLGASSRVPRAAFVDQADHYLSSRGAVRDVGGGQVTDADRYLSRSRVDQACGPLRRPGKRRGSVRAMTGKKLFVGTRSTFRS